jgi:ADP-heptose:LPS heptosyltransferase
LDTAALRNRIARVSTGGSPSPTQTKNLKVGLVWAGNPTHHNDAARSLRLEDLMPLLQTPGTSFFSLQQPVPARDEAHFQSVRESLNQREPFADFLETSAWVAEMDLIITVDTAIAHLAGALAKPVWTLLPFAADWRWFLERADTPWYPTMRLFRQKQRGDWRSVILQVAAALNDLSRAKKSGLEAAAVLVESV